MSLACQGGSRHEMMSLSSETPVEHTQTAQQRYAPVCIQFLEFVKRS